MLFSVCLSFLPHMASGVFWLTATMAVTGTF